MPPREDDQKANLKLLIPEATIPVLDIEPGRLVDDSAPLSLRAEGCTDDSNVNATPATNRLGP